MNSSRREWIAGGLALAATVVTRAATGAADKPSITVYKSPTCGCCAQWVVHLRASGFAVQSEDVPDLGPVKRRFRVPRELVSCHTGVVEGYVVEGHVPADLIDRLLGERPAAVVGIAVPGMPIGSPGMEVRGQPAERYRVLSFDAAGRTAVFADR